MSDDNPASIYETQLVQAIFEPLARILIERARPKPGAYVLDAACGTGIVARLVAPIVGPSGRTAGVDYDPIMIGTPGASRLKSSGDRGICKTFPSRMGSMTW